MGARHIGFLAMACAVFQLSCSAAAPHRGSNDASVADGTATVQRPSYNTGNGFFVRDGKLYDAKGNEFRIRGVNRVHWDSDSAAGLVRSGSNTVRWDLDFSRSAALNTDLVMQQSIDNGIVPVVGNWTGTCNSDPAKLSAIVSTWVAQASQWTKLDKYLIVNVANEWGPANSTVWRDSYISAIARLRAAGYTGAILVDSGGCGQDDADLSQYSQAVFESDPQRNVIFAAHLYGGSNDYSASIQAVRKGNPTVITLAGNSPTHPFAPNYNGSNNSYSGLTAYQIDDVQGMTQLNGNHKALQNVGGVPGAWTVTLSVDSTQWGDYTGGGKVVDNGNYAFRIAQLAALGRRTGAAYIVGEFGPGKNIGPSPTLVTPGQIITAAEANGIGWLAWAWDDNNLANCSSDDRWFSMTKVCGRYTQASDLTNFGKDVELDPNYGVAVLAKRASIFSK
jgi:Cellulase (glycosyl hydrolase family 5)